MTHEDMTAFDILRLVGELPAASERVRESESQISFIIYDAFAVTGSYDEYGRGNWGFSVAIGPKASVSQVLGRRLTIRGTREEVCEALQTIDWYARLRLGSEYLEAYAAAYPRS